MTIDLEDVKTWDVSRAAAARWLLRRNAVASPELTKVIRALTDRLKELGYEK
jgi:hypothetical protein